LIVVGAYGDGDYAFSNGLSLSGSVYIFTADAQGVYSQSQKLTAHDGEEFDWFGQHVAINNGVIVITAHGDDDKYDDSGSVYVFKADAQGVYSQSQKLTPNDAEIYGYFGSSVTLDNGVIVVGAEFDNDKDYNSGSAYVFTADSQGIYSQSQKLTASDGTKDDHFGRSIVIDNDMIVVGVSGDDDNGVGSGSAYIFTANAQGIYSQSQKLTANDGAEGDYFGRRVALDNGVIIIGSSRFDNDAESRNAYVFTADTQGSYVFENSDNYSLNTVTLTVTEKHNFDNTLLLSKDADDENLTYTLSGNDSALFNLSDTGILTFITLPNFATPHDSNANNDYQVLLTVSDGILSNELALTITVSDSKYTKLDGDGDGKADVLWRNSISGTNYLWAMDGVNFNERKSISSVNTSWNITGRGDFDGDGKSDILWRNKNSGRNYLWLMDGFTVKESKELNIITDLAWHVKAVADFNGDGKADIFWHHQVSGKTNVWEMDGFIKTNSATGYTISDTLWQVAGAGDINNDGNADIIWRHQGNGRNYVWLMAGTSFKYRYSFSTIATSWDIVGLSDLNGDGTDDILWRNKFDGRNWGYLMKDGLVETSHLINVVADDGWKVAMTGDFDGDGNADIFWHHQLSGKTYIYLMNGLTIMDKGFSSTVNGDWKIIHH
jgi:protocatechuate 3,4-dioxygenase beta subunit